MMLLLTFVLILISGAVDEFRIFQAANVSIYVVAISSVILLTGYSGQISLGQGALLAVGGYTATLLKLHFNSPLILCFLGAITVTAIFGLILGLSAARLSGPYLAGTTLALAVGLPSITNYFSWLGGEEGLIFDIGMPWKSLGENFNLTRWFFIIAAVSTMLAMWWMHNLVTSRYGRTWKAMRSHAVAAELAGINVSQQKVIAFGVSSGVAGAVALVAIPEISGTVAQWFGGAERVTNNLPNFIVNLLLIVTVLFVPDGPIEQMKRKRVHKR